MRKCVITTLAFTAALFVGSLAPAAAPARDLPPEVAGHVSVRSLRGLIRNIDRYVAAASKESDNEIPSGFLSMMAMIYLPIPLDDWESDGPVNLVVLNGKSAKDMPYVIFFQAADFDKLAGTLAESGWEVGERVDNGDFKEVRPVVVPGGDRKFLVDFSDGRIALAEKLEDIAAVQDGDWFPEHFGNADLRANIALKNRNNPLTRFVVDAIEKKKAGIIENIDEVGLKPEFAQGVGKALEKYGPLLAQEVDNVRFLLLELRFADGVAELDLGAKFEPGSLGDLVATGMGQSGDLDLSLANLMPPGALSMAVSYPATRVLPDAPNVVSKCFAEFVGTVIPDLKSRTELVIREFYDSKPGQAVSGNYMSADGGAMTVSYMPAEKPAETVDAILRIIDLMNAAWAGIIVSPDHGFKLVPTEKIVDGKPVYHFTEEYANVEKFQEFLDKIHEIDPDATRVLDPGQNLHIYITNDDKGVILGGGAMTPDEFEVASEYIRKQPALKNLFQSPAAQRLLGRIDYDQGTVGVMDPAGLFSIYAHAAAQAHDHAYGQPESNPYRVALAKLEPLSGEPKNAIAFALGADGSWLVNRFLVPAASVNDVAKLYDAYSKARKEAARDLNVPDEIDGQDGYEDDLETEEIEEDEDAA